MKPRDGRLLEALFVAEQIRLLVRLAADTGARRGELAVLRQGDLDGRVLSIDRNLSLEVLGPTKTSRNRRLTLGATARMIVDHFGTWQARVGPAAVVGDWVFAPDYRRPTTTPEPTCCRTASTGSDEPPGCPTPRCTACATASAPTWSARASS